MLRLTMSLLIFSVNLAMLPAASGQTQRDPAAILAIRQAITAMNATGLLA